MNREMALAEAARALKACFPDRWEELLKELGIVPPELDALLIEKRPNGQLVASRIIGGTSTALGRTSTALGVLDGLYCPIGEHALWIQVSRLSDPMTPPGVPAFMSPSGQLISIGRNRT